MKIRINTHGNELPVSHGEWVDLYTAEDVEMGPLDFKIISLGVAMELPEATTPRWCPGPPPVRTTASSWLTALVSLSIATAETTMSGDSRPLPSDTPRFRKAPVSASSSWSNRQSRLSLSRSMTSAILTAADGAAPGKADCEVDHGKAKRVSQA